MTPQERAVNETVRQIVEAARSELEQVVIDFTKRMGYAWGSYSDTVTPRRWLALCAASPYDTDSLPENRRSIEMLKEWVGGKLQAGLEESLAQAVNLSGLGMEVDE